MSDFKKAEYIENDIKENLVDGFAHHQVIYDDKGNPVDYKFLDVNDHFAQLTGLDKAEVIGKTVKEALPGIENSDFDWIGKYGEIAAHGGKEIFQAYLEPLGRWYEITAFSHGRGFFTTIFRDITPIKTEKEKTEKAMEYTRRCQGMSLENLDYQFFTDTVMELAEADFVFLNLISPEEEEITVTQAFSADDEQFNKAKQLFNFNLEGARWKTDYHKMQLGSQGKLVKFASFQEVGYYDRHSSIANVLKKAEKSLCPGDIYAMEMSYMNEPLGIMTLFMPSGQSLVHQELVEMYINQIAATIKRLRAEFDYQRKIEEQALLLDYTNFQVWFLKDSHTYGAVNQAHADFMGIDKVKLSNTSLYDLLDPGETDVCVEGNQKVFESKQEIYSEEWIKNGDGEPRLLAILKVPKLDKQNNVKYVVCSAEDITEKSQLEKELKYSRERYKNIVNSQKELICRFKNDTTLTFANQAFMEYFGLQNADLYQRKFLDFVPEEEHDFIKNKIDKLVQKKEPISYENRVTVKGKTKWQRWTDHPIFDEEGNITEIQSFGMDITELKQAEKDLKETQETFYKAMEATSDGIWDWNVESGEAYLSDNYYTMLGYKPGEFEANLETWRRLIHPEDRRSMEKEIEAMFAGDKKEFYNEFRAKAKDGSYKWIRGRGKVVEKDASGYPKRIVGSNIDIHEMKVKEKEILQSQNLLEASLNAIPDIVGIQYPDHTIMRYNQAGYDFLGLDSAAVNGQKCYHLLGREKPCDSCPTSQVLETGQPQEVEKHFHEKGIFLKIRSQPVFNESGEIEFIVEQIQNVTGYKMLVNELRKQNHLFESVLESIQDGIAVLNPDLTVRHVNNVMKTWHKSSLPIEGKPCYKAFHGKEEPCEVCPSQRAMETGEMEKEEFCFRTDQGDRWLEVYSYPMRGNEAGEINGTVEFVRDITERKRAERQIRYLSFHDSLTGLYNRAYMEQEMKRLDVARQLPLSVVVADVNELKAINDSYGHMEGDKLLVTAADILKESCRKEDIVARWGGDEFVILLPQTNAETAHEITQRIKKQCKKSINNEIVSIAVGAATKENCDANLNKIFQEAEDKMYKDKAVQCGKHTNDIVHALFSSLKTNSEETEHHTFRMAELGEALGKSLGLSEKELEKISLLAALHDIGELPISKEILQKPGVLSKEEWEKIKRHPETGKQIVKSSDALRHIAEEVESHHERWDGQGYPHGLKDKEIPLIARIIAIVDAYEVMTSGRSYKKSVSKEDALAELKRYAGKQFDPELVDAFIKGGHYEADGV